VSHLMQSVDKARLTAATIVTSQLDGLDMVHMAAESFGIDTRGLDKAATLKSIENFLHAEARTGRRCLLIVDEAQNLSIEALEELRMLSNFQLGSSALLQIFLLGQPEFRDLVRDAPELEQLRQRVIATHHLEPMDGNEVEPYIIHRLTRAGWNGRPQVTADAFIALYAETGGVPRKLNTLMNRVMLMGAVEQVDLLDGGLVEAVIADMAGKPFEYEAPMSARAPLIEEVPVARDELIVEATPVQEELVPAAANEHAEEVIVGEQVIKPAEVVFTPLAAVAQFETEPLAADDPAPLPQGDLDAVMVRIAALEQRVSEQDAALRRVIAMMIDWMDKEASAEARYMQASRAA
jgi:general secretion pathway protein A